MSPEAIVRIIPQNIIKDKYCTEKVGEWTTELGRLAKIAETEPQNAYNVYSKG